MNENPKHYKMISKDSIHIPTNDRNKEIRPYLITIYNDPYLQQLWLSLVIKYKHIFKKNQFDTKSPLCYSYLWCSQNDWKGARKFI